MQTERFEGAEARRVLTGMITDKTVCARIATQWQSPGLFDLDWANIVGGWCVQHLRRYGTSPNGQLTAIFEDWATKRHADDKTIDMVERFLQQLSDSHDPEQADHLLDLAGAYFNRVRLERAMAAAKTEMKEGEVDVARNRLTRLSNVELGVGSFCEPAEDFSVWEQAFNRDRRRSLVRYPGAFGQLIEGSFIRGEFYAYMAPDKTGKTTFLLDLAYRALRERCRVAFFDTGDSTRDEIMLRLACRLTSKPEMPGKYEVPKGWDKNGNLDCQAVKFDAVHPIDAFRELRRLCKAPDSFRLSCHPNSTLSAEGVDSILSDWERDGWVPDVIAVDYADIMASPIGVRDPLDQIDETWKRLRRISQERHALLLTATQSSAATYGKEDGVLTRKHFSGRKTKLAHVNGMLGINVSSKEKDEGTARINWIVRRRGKYNEYSCVKVAGNWDVGNPIVASKWGS